MLVIILLLVLWRIGANPVQLFGLCLLIFALAILQNARR